jgi:hypothetical protein
VNLNSFFSSTGVMILRCRLTRVDKKVDLGLALRRIVAKERKDDRGWEEAIFREISSCIRSANDPLPEDWKIFLDFAQIVGINVAIGSCENHEKKRDTEKKETILTEIAFLQPDR